MQWRRWKGKEGNRVSKPRIAVPIGDPAGIGPEIAAKAAASEEVISTAEYLVVGDKRIMERAIRIIGVENLKIHCVTDPGDGDYRPGILNLIDLANLSPEAYQTGTVDGKCGRAAYEYIKASVDLAMSGKVDAVATTPINKESLKAGNINYIGHTEIFGALTDTKDPLTMFDTKGLRIFSLTRHVSLREMLDLIRKDRIIDYVRRCTDMLRKLGVKEGTMAVAGLNPHSGEHGQFGWEEVREIMPAVEALKREGYDVEGPIGADSVFHQAACGKYNSVLSLYHDQGHIAAKTLDFDRTIAVTGGMPILRTSVDHGTAFDIAGTGKASALSMIEAVTVPAKYALGLTARK